MPSENVHHRKEKRKYTLILVPSGEAAKTKSVSFGRIGFAAILMSGLAIIVAIVLAVVVFTPMGTHLPISNPELENRYGKQLVNIQQRLSTLYREMTVLKEFNLRLRTAIGERVASGDGAATERPTMDTLISSPNLAGDEWKYPSVAGRKSPRVPQGQPLSQREKDIVLDEGRPREATGFASELPLTMPADGFLTRGFDPERNHFGIDIAGKEGSAILAAPDGNVVFSGWTYDDGFVVIIAHDLGFMTVYKHNQTILKSTGAAVKRSELIALMGSTGRTSSGPHLHFEVARNGVARNPNNYLLITQ